MLTNTNNFYNNNNNNNKRKDVVMQNDPQRSKEKRPKTQEEDDQSTAIMIGPLLPPTATEKEKEATERHHHHQPLLLLVPLGGNKKPKEGQRTHHNHHNNHQHVHLQLALDPNTANGSLSLSADHRTATYVCQKQPYPAHRERFCYWQQVLCADPLPWTSSSSSSSTGGGGGGGRWFLQVERSGWVAVALAYASIRRAAVDESLLGFNACSWSLECYDDDAPGEGDDRGGGMRGRYTRYTFCHDQEKTELPPRGGGGRRRCLGDDHDDDDVGVAVSVDVPNGVLKFYAVSASNTRTIIHTHREERGFHGPLYPAFRLGWCDSSVSLVQLHKIKG